MEHDYETDGPAQQALRQALTGTMTDDDWNELSEQIDPVDEAALTKLVIERLGDLLKASSVAELRYRVKSMSNILAQTQAMITEMELEIERKTKV